LLPLDHGPHLRYSPFHHRIYAVPNTVCSAQLLSTIWSLLRSSWPSSPSPPSFRPQISVSSAAKSFFQAHLPHPIFLKHVLPLSRCQTHSSLALLRATSSSSFFWSLRSICKSARAIHPRPPPPKSCSRLLVSGNPRRNILKVRAGFS